MATIKQVSELAGVSSATVSRVINDTGIVKEPTKQLVLDAMKKLGYRHNVIAASLASKKTNTVGYVVPALHGSFFGPMMSGSEALLRSAGKHMFIATGHSDEKAEKDAIEALLARRCDALILHVEAVSDEYLVELAEQEEPFVVVNRQIPAISDRCICLDNILGGYLATKHLLDLGHTQIAYLTGSMFKADAKDRLEGHKKALEEAGIAFDEALYVEGDFRVKTGMSGTQELLEKNTPFTAIVCGNDEMAAGALNTLSKHHKRVPNDISLVGFDNIEFSEYLTPPLTTVDYPMRGIGKMAALKILKQVYSHNSEQELIQSFSPEIVIRESTQSR